MGFNDNLTKTKDGKFTLKSKTEKVRQLKKHVKLLLEVSETCDASAATKARAPREARMAVTPRCTGGGAARGRAARTGTAELVWYNMVQYGDSI